ncbi:hypothetical protein RDI86_01355 [Cellulosimicrobium sp. XJ-DQ-B-000]|uniref:hypothetical protein n=1 Tax=Cellulosimicrobium sp. XJ-DQ-B-000 TaxID=3072182 RepID=UPI0028089982|nr:hypothetical protein [Cellulosimicrobium sp. XJ-DQ-B-000]MDQ8040495.1 hypothetical protein [Cellulosimicrobium sp. XJ-DQ-B-000]
MTHPAWSPIDDDGFSHKEPVTLGWGPIGPDGEPARVVTVQAVWTDQDGVAVSITVTDDEPIPAALIPAVADVLANIATAAPPGVTKAA